MVAGKEMGSRIFFLIKRIKTYVKTDIRRRRKPSVGYIFPKVGENGILSAHGDTSPCKKGRTLGTWREEWVQGHQICCSYRVFKRKPQAQGAPLVVKPMKPHLDSIPDLTAVSTSHRNTIINQSESFWSIP